MVALELMECQAQWDQLDRPVEMVDTECLDYLAQME
jgi:hypothetical protein